MTIKASVEKEKPLVTIITPVFNQEKFLKETIDSVLTQDYQNLEYIVINDGSTDGTEEILKSYSSKLYWETQTNSGETKTVNKGMHLAKGEIIGIVNSDDPLMPGAISAIVDMFLKNPELIVIYPDWNMIDAEGILIEKIKTFEYDYQKMVRWHHCMPGPCTLFKKEILTKLNGRDPDFHFVADFDFWLRAGLIGPFARLPKTVANFRWYPGGTSSALRGKVMADEHIQLVDKVFSLPNLPKDIVSIKREAYSSAYFIAGVVCGDNPELKKAYYKKALITSPIKYLTEYHSRSGEIIRTYFPKIYSQLRKIKKKLKWEKRV